MGFDRTMGRPAMENTGKGPRFCSRLPQPSLSPGWTCLYKAKTFQAHFELSAEFDSIALL